MRIIFPLALLAQSVLLAARGPHRYFVQQPSYEQFDEAYMKCLGRGRLVVCDVMRENYFDAVNLQMDSFYSLEPAQPKDSPEASK